MSSYTSFNNFFSSLRLGSLDEEGNAKPLPISTGSTVLYSTYAGNDFKGKDGSNDIILRAWDIIAIFS
ncbi:20 kDa chaperonin [Cardamine amara subsp. amara]|uniref:20 kDa chaperonin n=1 Tax=Cardamine amara subsp. amara TaxID=228776 RepID=A0ABD0ZCV3_CARAN